MALKYVGLYCRLSPRPDGSYEGVDLQERWGRRYAAAHWPELPVVVFGDKGISAHNGDQREGYDKLREWIRAGKLEHLWCVEQSRLERREAEWFQLAAELDAAGITELHTDREGIVRVRDEVAGIKAVINAGEARKLKRRVNDKLAELAAEGRPAGGRIFGYTRARDEQNKAVLHIDEDQAAILRDAADKILSGWSLSRTAADLTARGVRGANGAVITYKTLNRMLTNGTVAGYRVYRGEIVGRGLWEPILTEDVWQAVRAKLAAGQGTQSRTRRRFLLTGGIAVCGVCDPPTAMRAQRRKVYGDRLDAVYTCWHGFHVGVMADQLEEHVAAELLAEIDRPQFLNAITSDEHAARREAILSALTADENQRTELAKEWGAGGLTTLEWRSARNAIDEHEQKLRRDLANLPAPLIGIDISAVSTAWPGMLLDEKRELVEMFIEHVQVHPAKPGARTFDSARVSIRWRTL